MQFKDFIWSNLKLPLQRRVADEGHSKLYITFIQRNNTAGRGRSIVNIDAVYEATRELLPNSTIHITDLSSIPFSEQLELFAKTDVLVAVGGTALHNSLFMHPGTSILAIMPTAWCDWAW
jgi:capsular polysaccharide biosynthesis protein